MPRDLLTDVIEDLIILPEHQFAFGKSLGTELKILRVVKGIKVGFKRKDITLCLRSKRLSTGNGERVGSIRY